MKGAKPWTGERVRKLMRSRGWSDVDLARKLSLYMRYPVNVDIICNWRISRNNPGTKFIAALTRLELESGW